MYESILIKLIEWYHDLYFKSKLLLNCLVPFSYTKGGLLLEICWKVFLSLLRPSFDLSRILISMTLGSPANLGLLFVSDEEINIFYSDMTGLGAKGFLLVSIKDSEWLYLLLSSDVFFYFLNLLVRRRHELLLFSLWG